MVSIPHLKSLLVDHNGLCEVEAIGTNLYTNTSLTTLGLSHNSIITGNALNLFFDAEHTLLVTQY